MSCQPASSTIDSFADLDNCKRKFSLVQDCIAIEKGHPLLPQLMQYLQDDRPIYAAEGAVLQFELLLAQFGGFKERDRWQGWKERISIVDDSNKDDMSPRIAALADSSSMTEVSKIVTSPWQDHESF